MQLSFFTTFVSTALIISVAAAAGPGHGDPLSLAPVHHRVARRSTGSSRAPVSRMSKRAGNSRRCKPRPSSSQAEPSPTTHASSSSAAQASPTPVKSDNNGSGNASGGDAGSSVTTGAGLFGVQSGNCGDSGATSTLTATSGPNGEEDWLNCGLYGGGWTPPKVKVSDLKTVDLAQAIQTDGSPFKGCAKFIDTFYKYGATNGLPAILLASIAMQESSCNPNTVGGNGEQGLMQLTQDKCGDAPGGNCRDVDFNIRRGAEFFATTLKNKNGNVISAIGAYNGWYDGLTYDKATAAGNNPATCRAQNNVDYIHQFVNGWMLNHDSYSGTPRLGSVFNLDKCH